MRKIVKRLTAAIMMAFRVQFTLCTLLLVMLAESLLQKVSKLSERRFIA